MTTLERKKRIVQAVNEIDDSNEVLLDQIWRMISAMIPNKKKIEWPVITEKDLMPSKKVLDLVKGNHIPADIDYKEEYAKYLWEKYK